MNNVKKSIILSVLSLILCVAMLIGTTFAWFTDSASSGVNKIQAGNLKVDLVQRGNNGYVSIKNQSAAIFDSAETANATNNTLWEPGATHVAYLGVRNLGSLALKYNIVIDVTDYGLASALEYAIVPQARLSDASSPNTCTATVSDWANAKALAGSDNCGSLPAGNNRITASQNGCLDEIASNSAAKNETDYFALVIHMKEDAGNEYQGKNVTIDVNILATQKNSESDSFGNGYDSNSNLPALAERLNGEGKSKGIRKDGNNTDTVKVGDDQVITTETDVTIEVVMEKQKQTDTNVTIGSANVPAEAAIGVMNAAFADTETFKASTEGASSVDDVLVLTLNVETKEAKPSGLTLDVSMLAEATRTITLNEGTPVTENKKANVTELNEAVTVELLLDTRLEDVNVVHTHNGVSKTFTKAESLETLENEEFFYDKTTGKLTLKTNKFSEFEITYTAPEVCSHPSFRYEINAKDDKKHDKICTACYKTIATELHTYDSEDTSTCKYCSYTNVIKYSVTASGTPDNKNTFSLSSAIAAYNANNDGTKDYVIELEAGIYEVPVCSYDINQTKLNSGSTLTFRAKDMASATANWNVILKPTGVTNTGNLYFFSVSGGSSYQNGGSIMFEGLKFDMSNSTYAGSDYSSARLFGVYCCSGTNARYAHDVTIDKCNFIGCGGKFASAVGANNSNSSPSAIKISNCTGDKLNCWFNGYVGDGSGFGLKFSNLTSTNFLCLLNNQSGVPTITLDNVDGSFFYAVSGEYSTEYAVVYTIGGTLNIKDCDWSLLAKPNSSKTGPAFVNTNGKALGGNLTITTATSTFANSTGVTVNDVYVTNLNGKTATVNGIAMTANGAKSFS